MPCDTCEDVTVLCGRPPHPHLHKGEPWRALEWFREKTGFCCRALTGGVDAVDITLSDALLAALSRRASHTLKPPPTRLPAEKPLAALGKLGKLLDEVSFLQYA